VVSQEGELIAWQDGRPVTLAELGARPWRIVETAIGIIGSESDVVVRRDGTRTTLPVKLGINVAASADGLHVATIETHRARHGPLQEQLHWLDLGTGDRITAPLDPHDLLYLVGVARGRVYVTIGAEAPHTAVWTPGAGIEHLDIAVRQVEPVSGATLHYDADRRPVVTRPDGSTLRIDVESWVILAPGGNMACAIGESLTVVDLARGDQSRFDLPADVDARWSVWEDREHLLMPVSSYDRGIAGADALRCHVPTGRLERLDLERRGEIHLGEFAFVQPALAVASS
jgi:hypothetical protein